MDYEVAKFWLQFLNFAVTLCVGLYVWSSNRHRVTNERIGDLEKGIDVRLDAHDSRLATLEGQVKAAPTHADLAQIHEKINTVAQCSSRMEGEMKSQTDLLRLVLNKMTRGDA
ncbi:hypothetical protein METUNv1_01770 [Methyloversatilis universalis FAM5]|uniref:DUF2730 family protein n=2 Tax=Methyloversatilis universalis TaxID=378211 RepID=F5RBX5_METUF|nr:hypothetical protein METUNv1_01770 [Methyloversatilis universalis FAM5]